MITMMLLAERVDGGSVVVAEVAFLVDVEGVMYFLTG